MGFGSFERERSLSKWHFKKVGSKNPRILIKGCTRPETFRSYAYRSILNMDDLTEIQVLYRVLREFDLELFKYSTRANNPSLGRLEVYKEAFKDGLRFFIPFFLLDLLRFYKISLCTITLNSLRLVIGFLVVCFLAEVRSSLSLFRSFYTIKRYPYTKD